MTPSLEAHPDRWVWSSFKPADAPSTGWADSGSVKYAGPGSEVDSQPKGENDA